MDIFITLCKRNKENLSSLKLKLQKEPCSQSGPFEMKAILQWLTPLPHHTLYINFKSGLYGQVLRPWRCTALLWGWHITKQKWCIYSSVMGRQGSVMYINIWRSNIKTCCMQRIFSQRPAVMVDLHKLDVNSHYSLWVTHYKESTCAML